MTTNKLEEAIKLNKRIEFYEHVLNLIKEDYSFPCNTNTSAAIFNALLGNEREALIAKVHSTIEQFITERMEKDLQLFKQL